MNSTLTLSPDSQTSMNETVDVFFTQLVHCRNVIYLDYLVCLSQVLKYTSFLIVNNKYMSNELEQLSELHLRIGLLLVLSSTCDNLMTFVPICSVLFDVRKI